jgi:hypothetical protein
MICATEQAEAEVRISLAALLRTALEIQAEMSTRRQEYEICMAFHSRKAAGRDEEHPVGYVAGDELYRRQERTYRRFFDLHLESERVLEVAALLVPAAASIREDFAMNTWRTGEFGLPPRLVAHQCAKTCLYLERLLGALQKTSARCARASSRELAEHRATKLRAHCENTKKTRAQIYTKAKVDKADFYRWLRGEWPDQSAISIRIEREISNDATF